LKAIVLTADVSEKWIPWERMAGIPFGGGHEDLGIKPSHETPVIAPNSFAVAPDGTYWIIDAAKQRVVHYSSSGGFLGEVTDSVGSGSTDMAFVGTTLWVISVHHKGLVFPILADGRRSAPSAITEAGKLVYVQDFIPTPRGLFAEVIGYPDLDDGGPSGIFKVQLPDPGELQEVSGFQLKNRTYVHLDDTDDQSYDLYFVRNDRTTIQPIRVRVVSSAQYGSRTLRGPVGLSDFVVDGNDVYILVQMSVTKPGTHGEQIGGRYLLRVGQAPLVFQRLPDTTPNDDRQVRHLALGPAGRIYLMYIGQDGVTIYRR
jgi:hypothetical protein